MEWIIGALVTVFGILSILAFAWLVGFLAEKIGIVKQ